MFCFVFPPVVAFLLYITLIVCVQIWHIIAGIVNVKWLKFIAGQIVADYCSDSFTYTQHCAEKCGFVFLLSVFCILFLSKLIFE